MNEQSETDNADGGQRERSGPEAETEHTGSPQARGASPGTAQENSEISETSNLHEPDDTEGLQRAEGDLPQRDARQQAQGPPAENGDTETTG